ncbi:MAG: transglutaminase domain-containing protein [Sedimentisphaerales bacterium]|nr:transglutaminase domain-containing protein [Sedimentisphaerales bacterium]
MKKTISLFICFILLISIVSGCKNKSDSEQPKEPNTTTKNIESSKLATPASKPIIAEDKTESVQIDTKPITMESLADEDESDGIEYFALLMDSHKIGYAVEERVVDGDIVKTSIEMNLTLSRVGVTINVTTKSSSTETKDGKPLGFEIVQDLGLIATKTVGTINEDGKLIVTSGQNINEMDWPEGALMSEGMRLLHCKTGLKEGASYKAKMFEPSTLTAFDVEVNVGAKQQVDLLGRVVELTELKTTATSEAVAELNADEYYDDDLKLQKSVTPVMGMVIEQVACSKEFALGKNDVYEIVDKMFLASPQPIDNINSVKSITYHITKTNPEADLQFLSTDNQKVQKSSNGDIVLTIEKAELPKGITIPYKGSDKDALEALRSSRFVESDEKIIKDLAKKAIGNTKDASEAARKIESFVADYIDDKSLSVGYASAAEVAKSKQGDCSEHAVLTAALCRAAGIPAQVATGVVYVSQWQNLSNGFGGHAWTRVYIGDKWYNIDAAFKSAGFGGYDPGHITLAFGNGDPEGFLNIVNTLGQFKIEKIEIKK